MKINSNYTTDSRTNFKAKFFNSDSLKKVADYAVEHGKFDKLNQARKNIDGFYLQTRLLVDIGETTSGKPFITFSRYVPKANVAVAMSPDDYKIAKVVTVESSKKENLLKFALDKLIKMGNNAPQNNLYKRVVVKK